MEIDSRYVGARSNALTLSLSPRQTMNYAAALGDNNPWYFDDSRAGGIVAPPMLAVALTWPLSSRFDLYWGDTDFPVEAQLRQVHYNETVVWARTMVPDEQLNIQGEIVAMAPHPAGTLITIRYDACGRDRDPVFTEHIIGLLRGVTLTDGGAGAPAPHIGGAPSAQDGPLWSIPVPIDPLAAHVYDGCTDIVFPIHTSVAFSRQVGLPDPIYHGTATLGIAVREILNREAGGDPARLLGVQCGFRGMVFPGTTITVCGLGVAVEPGERHIFFEVKNASGESVLRNGLVRLR